MFVRRYQKQLHFELQDIIENHFLAIPGVASATELLILAEDPHIVYIYLRKVFRVLFFLKFASMKRRLTL
jgi:hypothetical protein